MNRQKSDSIRVINYAHSVISVTLRRQFKEVNDITPQKFSVTEIVANLAEDDESNKNKDVQRLFNQKIKRRPSGKGQNRRGKVFDALAPGAIQKNGAKRRFFHAVETVALRARA
jgi:hypothetical protein